MDLKPRVWHLAAAGNSAALVLLVGLLSNHAVLFGEVTPSGRRVESAMTTAQQGAISAAVAERVLFIVIDGLRIDTAADRYLMPHLAHLASQGGTGTAHLEALVPSTVAAIRTFATGEVPPPASFLGDFRAQPAPAGGLFAVLARHGWRSFVAGPRLWTDLYGAWIAAALPVDTGGADDARVLQAGLAALEQLEYRFVVVHFGQPDDAGHVYGARSPAYAQAVAWCDAAIGRLWSRAGEHTAVLVTADHGMIDNGGHAGPERLVRQTPVVIWGRGMPRGAHGTLWQRDIPHVLLGAAGLKMPATMPLVHAGAHPWSVGTRAVLIIVALACSVRLWSALAGSAAGRYEATVLNCTWWIVLLLCLLAWPRAALCLTLVVLGSTALRQAAHPSAVVYRALCWGVLFGALRLGDGLLVSEMVPDYAAAWLAYTGGAVLLSGAALAYGALAVSWRWRQAGVSVWWHTVGWTMRHSTPRWLASALVAATVACLCGGVALLAVYSLLVLLGIGLGAGLRLRRMAAVDVGMQCALWPVVLARWLGETISLSTIDVRAAFALIYDAAGLPAAVMVVAARHAVPTFGLLLGLAPVLVRLTPGVMGRCAVGMAAGYTAQALCATGLLALQGTHPVWGALALGTWCHLLAELMYGFLGAALTLWLSCHARSLS